MPRKSDAASDLRDSFTPRRTKRWERRSEVRPAELVAAALALFSERGFAGTRLEDVAARAGVSKATVYLYFSGKQQLFEAVVRAAITPNIDRAEQLIDAFDGSTPNLIRSILLLFESALDSPVLAVVKLILAESGNFPELARAYAELVVRRGLSLMKRVIQRGVDRGEFRQVRAEDIAPLVIAPVLMLGLLKQAFEQQAGLRIDRRAVLGAHAETLLRGLALNPSGTEERTS